MSKWLGAGDYEVSRNSLVSKAASGIPAMHNTGQTVIVRHKEYIGQIVGSTGFQVQYELVINPANQSLFPWLSQIARGFQEYSIKGMVYHYIPTSGSYSTTGSALGSVMIQTTYRADESAPNTKQEMLNEYWANEVVPYETMAHPIECDPKENPFSIHYVKDASVTVNEPLLYNMGKTFVATAGNPNTGVLGDLWVTYEVELKKPQVVSALTPEPSQQVVVWPSPSASNLFQNTPTYNSGGMSLTWNGARTIYIPQGAPSGVYVLTFVIKANTYLNRNSDIYWNGDSDVLTNCSLYPFYGTNSNFLTAVSGSDPLGAQTLWRTLAVLRENSSVISTIALTAPAWSSGSTDSVTMYVFSTQRVD